MAILEENRDMLQALGLTVEPFSETEVAVRSVPVVLGQNEAVTFLREAIEELESGRTPGADKKRAAILQMACKHAVKGGERVPEEELTWLVTEILNSHIPPTCPHGRPLMVTVTHTELDKRFRRIQQ
jgi:DNA mismatch repair protein MutL